MVNIVHVHPHCMHAEELASAPSGGGKIFFSPKSLPFRWNSLGRWRGGGGYDGGGGGPVK